MVRCRVLRPPGGGSNISFGTDEEQTASRKNKMASSIFAEPEDPHAFRRNNPPGNDPFMPFPEHQQRQLHGKQTIRLVVCVSSL